MEHEISWIEGVTIAVAFSGLLLGVINTMWSLTRDRERLAVIVEDELPHINALNEKNPMNVRVVNIGYYPVTLNDFHLSRRWKRTSIGVNYFYHFDSYQTIPQRDTEFVPPTLPCLAPGEEFRFQIWHGSIDRPAASEKIDPHQITGICVISASGKRFHKRSRLLQRYLCDASNS